MDVLLNANCAVTIMIRSAGCVLEMVSDLLWLWEVTSQMKALVWMKLSYKRFSHGTFHKQIRNCTGVEKLNDMHVSNICKMAALN